MRSFLINSLSSVEVWGNYLNGLHTIIHLPSLPCIVEKFCKNAGSDNGWASQHRKICERATSFRIKEGEWKNSMTTKNILFWLSLFHLKRILKKHLWIWMVNMNLYIIIYRKKATLLVISWYVSGSLSNISLHFNTTQEETKHFQRGIINQ